MTEGWYRTAVSAGRRSPGVRPALPDSIAPLAARHRLLRDRFWWQDHAGTTNPCQVQGRKPAEDRHYHGLLSQV